MKSAYITGIHNYCDRWCERCTLTSNCRSYDHTGPFPPSQTDIINEKFWNNLDEQLKQHSSLLSKAANTFPIPVSNGISAEDAAAYEQKRLSFREATRSHPLSTLCKQYQQLVVPFLENNNHVTAGIPAHLELISEDHPPASIKDCVAIIQWYLFFMDAKLQRALHGKMDDDIWETENGIPKDSDGSAKVALLAVHRSIAAWVYLLNQQPASEDIALPALAILQQLQQTTEKEFPKAMLFKRPGFDK